MTYIHIFSFYESNYDIGELKFIIKIPRMPVNTKQ